DVSAAHANVWVQPRSLDFALDDSRSETVNEDTREMFPARVPVFESSHDPSTSLGMTPGRPGMTAGGHRGKSSLKSRNFVFRLQMTASFFSRLQRLTCFSLLMAFRTSPKGSK